MRQSIMLRQELRDSIKSEIAERTKIHQAKIAALKMASARPLAAGVARPAQPLVMLAHGDSWFDYPLNGNSPSFSSTDVIAQLESMGSIHPVIHNISHHGDATTQEMSWPKQERLIQSLQDPANWMAQGRPDAILFSGGGNDIAGDQFCIFLDYADTGGPGLDPIRFQDALDMVGASYLDLFLFRDRNAHGVPIFGHCYDFPIPNGAHPICVGPWLLPSLRFCGWDTPHGTVILNQSLTAFRKMLEKLASDPHNNFTLVPTQGVLAPSDWANELHPHPGGFQKIAAQFVTALRTQFPGRI